MWGISNSFLNNPSGTLDVYATGNTATELPINSPVTQPLTGGIELNASSWLEASGDAGGKINIQGGDIVINNSLVTADSLGSGNAVGVSIKGSLSLVNGGLISSDTWNTGNGGNVNIDAGNVLVDGQGNNLFTGIISNTNDDALTNAGNAGAVSVKANNLTVTNGGQISSDAWGSGNAGNVAINAANILVDGQGMARGFPVIQTINR